MSDDQVDLRTDRKRTVVDPDYCPGSRPCCSAATRNQALREQIEEVIDEAEEEGQERRGSSVVGDLSPIERKMLRNLLHFGEQTVDDVAVPRADIIAIPESASFAEVVALFAEAGHSRLPVYRENLDEVVGMIHVKDVFAVLAEGRSPPPLLDLIRQPLYVPQSMGVLDLLAEMRAKRTHLAIVIDEYSGTEGLLTIEDLVEEIVGEIEDEHDDEPTALFVPGKTAAGTPMRAPNSTTSVKRSIPGSPMSRKMSIRLAASQPCSRGMSPRSARYCFTRAAGGSR